METNLKTEVLEDLKSAMRNKEAGKLEAIRAVKAALDKFEKENPGDVNYAKALKPLVKQRIDSIEQFKKAGSDDLAKKEEVELAIINDYLVKVQPKQMTKDEIEAAVKAFVDGNADIQATGNAGMGKVMSYFKTNYDGLYDGKELSSIVKSVLS